MARRSDYYNDSYGHNHSERQSTLWIILKIIFTIAASIAAITLAITLFAPVVNPSVWGLFSLLGVAAPAIYLVNFIFAMVLIIRWKWKIALPVIILLIIGGGKISRFAKMDFSTHYSNESYRGTSKIMSYNLRLHYNDNKDWSTPDLMKYFDVIAPDILCVQELNEREWNKHVSDKLKKYNRFTTPSGTAIFSRYPIVATSGDISIRDNDREVSSVIWADLKIANDTIRVFNNHLMSTMIKESDDEYLTSQKFISDSMLEYKFKSIYLRLKNNSVIRASHADSIAKMIKESPYEVLVCGDFNDTPMSYVYNSMSQNLNDAFVECGVGYPYTYRGFLNMLRIDYILASEGIEFKSYTVDKDIKLSDHNPVISHFSINK